MKSHECARHNSVEYAKILLDLGCNVNAAATDGRTPLSFATEKANCREMVKLLRSHSTPATFGNGARGRKWMLYEDLLKDLLK